MSASATVVQQQLQSAFSYTVEASNNIWEKIVIHDSVVTLYYRILRGKAGQAQDEALFAVAPTCYEYIFDNDDQHKGLHKYDKTNFMSHIDEPGAADFMFLHRHIKLKQPLSISTLQAIISTFRKLEPACAQHGKYEIGKYIFLSDRDEASLIEGVLQHLKLKHQTGLASIAGESNKNEGKKEGKLEELLQKTLRDASSAHNSSGSSASNALSATNNSFMPQYILMEHTKPDKAQAVRESIAKKLGSAFMKKHGSALSMEMVDVDKYRITITLPLSESGKQWFLNKEPTCQFELVAGGTKVTIPFSIISSDSIERHMRTLEQGGEGGKTAAAKITSS